MTDDHKGRTLQAGVTNEEEVNHFSDESNIYMVLRPKEKESNILCLRQSLPGSE